MNPNTSQSSATHARWRTRAVTFCALVCSAFLAGNVDAGEYSSDLGSIILRLQDLVSELDDWHAEYRQDYPDLYLEVSSVADQATAILQSLDHTKTTEDGADVFRVILAASQFDSLTSSLRTLDLHMRSLGVGSVTNFLGETDFDEFREKLANQFMYEIEQRLPQWVESWASEGNWFSYAGNAAPYIVAGTIPMSADGQPAFDEPLPNVLGYTWENLWYPDLQALVAGVGSSNGVQTATTNLLTTQNATLDRVAEYVAGVSNAVGTISTEYETDPTGSNDLPSEETPDALRVEKSVDTSSLEDAVQQTFDGLDSLTPSGSSTVPEIMIRDAYRGEDAIKVRLDLHEIGIATRVCKACWSILLAVGVLGIVRSEWDYWTTLGGSAT